MSLLPLDRNPRGACRPMTDEETRSVIAAFDSGIKDPDAIRRITRLPHARKTIIHALNKSGRFLRKRPKLHSDPLKTEQPKETFLTGGLMNRAVTFPVSEVGSPGESVTTKEERPVPSHVSGLYNSAFKIFKDAAEQVICLYYLAHRIAGKHGCVFPYDPRELAKMLMDSVWDDPEKEAVQEEGAG